MNSTTRMEITLYAHKYWNLNHKFQLKYFKFAKGISKVLKVFLKVLLKFAKGISNEYRDFGNSSDPSFSE